MDEDLLDLLLRYLAGRMTWQELADAIDAFDIWNVWQDGDPAITALREPLGQLELITTDSSEGLRDQQDLRDLAAELLRSAMQPKSAAVN